MDYLIGSTQDIFTTTYTPAAKTITLSGCNDIPLDLKSISSVYDATVNLPFLNAPSQFSWFWSNGLPIFVWIYTTVPAGSAGSDTLNIMLAIPQNQAQFILQQKQASASAGSPGTFTGGETPTGTVNGTNQVFTLAATPIAGTVVLLLNGVLQTAGTAGSLIPNTYTISGGTITFVTAPTTGSTVVANYYH